VFMVGDEGDVSTSMYYICTVDADAIVTLDGQLYAHTQINSVNTNITADGYHDGKTE
jgi:hypothetical protein